MKQLARITCILFAFIHFTLAGLTFSESKLLSFFIFCWGVYYIVLYTTVRKVIR